MKRSALAAFSRIIFIAIPILVSTAVSYAAERGETETMIRTMVPPVSPVAPKEEKKDTLTYETYCETSGVLQGSRTGYWEQLDNRFSYTHKNITSYFMFSDYKRFDDRDHTASFGTYINQPNYYTHLEVGFGWQTNYMYKLQTIAEYGHKLYKTLFWQVGYSYRAYLVGDTHIVYPGLIYYFGDNYIAGEWGVSWIESRDAANFGSVKGNFKITDFLQAWGGVAFGERLYDIYAIKSAKEAGYILFGGLTYNLYKGISMRAGYTYGAEKPKFIKRGVNFTLSVKF